MALFKILSNMDDSSKSMPNTYNKGYCYFDVNTKKFWIDTTDAASGRVAINAPRADIAALATQIPFGTCATAGDALNKQAILDTIPWMNTIPTNGTTIPAPPDGTIVAVYFQNANSVANTTLQLKFANTTATTTSVPVYLNYPNKVGATKSKSWDSGSVVLLTYMSSNSGMWVMSSGTGGSSGGIYYVKGPSTDTTAGTWTGTHSEINALEEGLTLIYVPAVAGAATTTLNINGLGAKTCYYSGTSKLTTHFAAGTPIMFTYYNNGWRRADYNSNSDTKLRVYTQNTGYNSEYPVLVSRTGADTLTAKANGEYTDVYGVIYTSNAPTVNPSTGKMSVPGGLIGSLQGNASTATEFSSNATVQLTGDVTGEVASKKGWTVATTLSASGVTAGTYGTTSQQTPSYSETFSIPYFTVDAKGRVTSAGTSTVAIPADTNTWRPVVDALDSTSVTSSLSANQGRVLNNKFANYLPLAGGTMTGGINLVGNQSSAWNDKGLVFTNGSRIGENTSGAMGFYSAEKIYIRPDSGTQVSTAGVEIDSGAVIPSQTNTMSLGDSSHKWTTVYAGTFSGNATNVNVTDTTPTSTTTYYLTYTTGRTTGQVLRGNTDLYYYDTGSTSYLNVGSSSHKGGLTLHNSNSYYSNIIPADGVNANQTVYLPNASGTIALTTSNVASADKVNHTLTFGDSASPLYSFDGSADVNVPLYNGAVS